MRNGRILRGNQKNNSIVQDLDAYEYEEEGFSEGGVVKGKTVASFSFSSEEQSEKGTSSGFIRKGFSFSEGTAQSPAAKTNGQTPRIDGEAFTIKRGYQFRPSTIRKLHELKASHADINVYLNTIIDEAILFYYNYIVASQGEVGAVSHGN